VDWLLGLFCPETADAAQREGAYSWLRDGALRAIKAAMGKGRKCINTVGFDERFPELFPFVSQLSSTTYYVPSRESYEEIEELVETDDAEAIEEAARFMQLKGEECLAEARRLRELAAAIRRARAHTSEPV
jgi:hypothetical protein